MSTSYSATNSVIFYIVIAYFSVAFLTMDLHGIRPITVWLTSVVLVGLSVALVAQKTRIKRLAFIVILISSLWVIYALPYASGLVSKEHHIKAILEYTLYVLSMVALLAYLDSISRIFKAIHISFLIFIWVAIFVLFLLIIGIDINGPKAFSSIYNNRNVFATVAIIYLSFLVFTPSSVGLGHLNKHGKKYVAILLVLIVLTASTKALLGVILVVLFYFMYRYGKSSLILLPIVAIPFFVILFSTDLEIVERFNKKIDAVVNVNEISSENIVNESGKIRVFLILEAIEVIKQYPLKGVGVNNAQFYMDLPLLKDGKTVDSQNNITEMVLNAGLPGFALYYLPLVMFLFMLLFNRSRKVQCCNEKELRFLLITLIFLKLSWDVGMKSYNELQHVFLYIFVIFVYLKCFYLRGKNV